MKKPRSLFLAAAGAAALAGVLAAPRETQAQAPADEAIALAQIITEITKQQAAIVKNQTDMDAKLAVIAENLRIARIYASRGGGAGGQPSR